MLRLIGSLQRMMQGLNLKDYIRHLRSNMTVVHFVFVYILLNFYQHAVPNGTQKMRQFGIHLFFLFLEN